MPQEESSLASQADGRVYCWLEERYVEDFFDGIYFRMMVLIYFENFWWDVPVRMVGCM